MKIAKLREKGYEVIVLWECETKDYDGMKIRDLIFKGDDAWKEQVPPSTVRIVEKQGIRERITKLRQSGRSYRSTRDIA